MRKLEYSGSPHIAGVRTTKTIMLDVVIALLPAVIMSVIYFGVNALAITLVSVIGAMGAEIVYKMCEKVSFKDAFKSMDNTSLITGILIGMNMPPFAIAQYWYIPLLSSIFVIVFVKMMFGGTGTNVVNPAITGRVFALISFTIIMTQSYSLPLVGAIGGDVTLLTGATPLTEMLLPNGLGSGAITGMNLTNLDLFLGTGVAGSIGETSKLALLIGGIYLVVRKVIDWKWPTIYILVVGVMSVALSGFDMAMFLPSMLSGGLFLGAIFMATDYTTSPNSKVGCYIYFVTLGLVTALLRYKCKMEVVSFSIMLMNLIVPLIDKYVIPKPFGYQKKVKEAK